MTDPDNTDLVLEKTTDDVNRQVPRLSELLRCEVGLECWPGRDGIYGVVELPSGVAAGGCFWFADCSIQRISSLWSYRRYALPPLVEVLHVMQVNPTVLHCTPEAKVCAV